jgi:hypothetical protein
LRCECRRKYSGYSLPEPERGRSALELGLSVFERIIPGAANLDGPGWSQIRATHTYLSRVTDWTIGEAIGSTLSPEGHRFVTDAFGYDSGLRAFNAADAIEYLLGGGDPAAEARTPNDGMDAIPRALAASFAANRGSIMLGHELQSHEVEAGAHRLRFTNGAEVTATRLVLAVAAPALRLLSDVYPCLARQRCIASSTQSRRFRQRSCTSGSTAPGGAVKAPRSA